MNNPRCRYCNTELPSTRRAYIMTFTGYTSCEDCKVRLLDEFQRMYVVHHDVSPTGWFQSYDPEVRTMVERFIESLSGPFS